MRGATLFLAGLFLAGSALAGCADDLTIRNPKTGDQMVCRQSAQGLDPWSQTQACVADHLAQGWVVAIPAGDDAKAR
jgi:hypothetical protein